jgi:hypothetical protein
MIILGQYKLLINTGLLTAFLPIFGGKAAMWVNLRMSIEIELMFIKKQDYRTISD